MGPNGAGKSTLMRIICGAITADRGEVSTVKGCTFGYLPQEGIVARGSTLLEEVKSGLSELLDMQRKMADLEVRLEHAKGEDTNGLLESYGDLQDQFDARGGYTIDAVAGSVLRGLGFSPDQWERPCSSFSGGWQMRIALARLLVKRPSILLLDEPTNHLDIEARNWLEDYLLDYPGAVILVSHDRFFLDMTVNRCAEIARGKLVDFHSNFSGFEKEREKRWAAVQKAYVRQQEEIQRLERFITKFRYKATKAAQVQSRVKMLEKMVRIDPPPEPPRRIRVRLPVARRSGRIVLEAEGIRKSYGDLLVLDGVGLRLLRGEKVALVGHNGAGKTTLLRILAGALERDSGLVELGYQVLLSYFAQDQSQELDPENTVLREVAKASAFDRMAGLRSMLGSFLFSGDSVDKPISVISGGERNRVALAKLLLAESNLLLLDEPTNHLDLASKDVLLEALKNYEGTVLFVSHDRHFVNGLADKILEIDGGRIEETLGRYEEYLEAKMAKEAGFSVESQGVRWWTTSSGQVKEEVPFPPDGGPPEDSTGTCRNQRRKLNDPRAGGKRQKDGKRQKSSARLKGRGAEATGEARKLAYRRRREEERRLGRRREKLQRRLESIQTTIEERETEVAHLEKLMATPGFFTSLERSKDASKRHADLIWEVKSLYDQWALLEMQIQG